jgi:glycerol-3-phosphate dehydrogenase
MKVALVEMQDFAQGTSSRSTKLVHGGYASVITSIQELLRGDHFHKLLHVLYLFQQQLWFTQRGMKVALVEMQDFAQGTSSRSTKLVHGGLRYLKQALLTRC